MLVLDNSFYKSFRNRFLSIGSNTVMRYVLTNLFIPAYIYMIVYILLLSDIIPTYELNVKHLVLAVLSFLFISVYSFFNEILYKSHIDMLWTIFGSSVMILVTGYMSF